MISFICYFRRKIGTNIGRWLTSRPLNYQRCSLATGHWLEWRRMTASTSGSKILGKRSRALTLMSRDHQAGRSSSWYKRSRKWRVSCFSLPPIVFTFCFEGSLLRPLSGILCTHGFLDLPSVLHLCYGLPQPFTQLSKEFQTHLSYQRKLTYNKLIL